MAEKQVKAAAEIPDVVLRAKGFWDKYSKYITIIGLAVIVLGGVYYGYKHFYKIPREEKASELIFPGEKLFSKMTSASSFNKDSVNTVLNGGILEGNNITGMLKIISGYSGTAAANRAQYITGCCYLQVKEYDKAIKYLKEFDGGDAYQVQSKAYLLIGHAYAEKKNADEALSYYKKAAGVNKNDDVSSSFALYVAGRYAESTGKTKEAIELFKQLKEEYPSSTVVIMGNTDKYLARLGVTN